jgi:antitoxin component YwqK of YwqJK toxin-antitoxin module
VEPAVIDEFTGTYKDGERDGPLVEYHDNGQLQSKGTFKDGVKVK